MVIDCEIYMTYDICLFLLLCFCLIWSSCWCMFLIILGSWDISLGYQERCGERAQIYKRVAGMSVW